MSIPCGATYAVMRMPALLSFGSSLPPSPVRHALGRICTVVFPVGRCLNAVFLRNKHKANNSVRFYRVSFPILVSLYLSSSSPFGCMVSDMSASRTGTKQNRQKLYGVPLLCTAHVVSRCMDIKGEGGRQSRRYLVSHFGEVTLLRFRSGSAHLDIGRRSCGLRDRAEGGRPTRRVAHDRASPRDDAAHRAAAR